MRPAGSLETCDKKLESNWAGVDYGLFDIPAGTGVESSLKISYQPGTGIGSCSKNLISAQPVTSMASFYKAFIPAWSWH
jgi:hypothetical protein